MRIYIERREFKMSERESFLLVFLLAGFCGLKNYKAKKKKKEKLQSLVSVSSRDQDGSGHYPGSWPGRADLSTWLEQER